MLNEFIRFPEEFSKVVSRTIVFKWLDWARPCPYGDHSDQDQSNN
jgi:hypothetical protein